MFQTLCWRWIALSVLLATAWSRKHHLVLSNDERKLFPISTFGYFPGGSLNVTVAAFNFKYHSKDDVSNQIGFTLMETANSNYSPNLEGERICLLDNKPESYGDNIGVVQMRLDFKNLRVQLSCNSRMSDLYLHSAIKRIKRQDKVVPETATVPESNPQLPLQSVVPKPIAKKDKAVLDNAPPAVKPEEKPENIAPVESDKILAEESFEKTCYEESFPIKVIQDSESDDTYYTFNWQMTVPQHSQGLYQLYFHNCLNYPLKHYLNKRSAFNLIDMDLYLEEKNIDNYLSAGEMPLPQLYFILSIVFFLLGVIWFYSLQSKQSETFRIHYLMGVLVFVKSISLFFHGVNYYFIAKEGTQVETWAILYYVTHFLKGALLFFTIVLIGTGWAFVKHILSDKDKKIFMIVIPLQIIANVADIIIEESEEGAMIHKFGRQIFIMVDLICCGAILFPVIWSIHHLQESSQTDGKAALSLRKLQLFRQFYVMIVVYIYFTRIAVYLVKIMVPFNYQWLEQLFQHLATFIFFIMTGYRFQPRVSNPYHQLLQEEIEMDEEVLFIQPSTFTEAKKRHRDLESSRDKQTLLNAPYEFD